MIVSFHLFSFEIYDKFNLQNIILKDVDKRQIVNKTKASNGDVTRRETATDKVRLKDNVDNKVAVSPSRPLNCYAAGD